MHSSHSRDHWRKWTAFFLTLTLIMPLMLSLTPSASAQIFGGNRNQTVPGKKGMSTGQKVLLIGGAALLYFLYRKHQANAASKQTANGATAQNGTMPQLYRSRNGGVYYRDAQHRPVWLTVPQQQVQVSQQELRQYAPDYNRYQGPAPSAPRGYRVQPFSDFDSNMFGDSPARGGGSSLPPGPGRF